MSKKTCIFIAFVLLLSFTFTACGSSSETPEQAVTNALNAVKNLDENTAQKYFAYDELFISGSSDDKLIDDDEDARLLLSKLNFKVISSSKDGDTATVKTEITNIDMATVLDEYLQQVVAIALSYAFSESDAKSEEEMMAEAKQVFTDLLKRDDNEMKTSTIDIKLSRNENSWKIDANDEFKDAMLGGLVSASGEIANSFEGSDSP